MRAKKGDWVSYCCQTDLHELTEDEDIDDDLGAVIWISKEEAIKDLIQSWEDSRKYVGDKIADENIEQCKSMI